MRKAIDYLKERLEKAIEEVDFLKEKIRMEEKKAQLFEVRVIVETKSFGERDWRRTTLSGHILTLEQRDRLIANLAWLRRV